MRASLATAAVFGLSSMLVGAAPVASSDGTSVDPTTLPPQNGFPNPSTAQTKKIQEAAFGTLPNGSVPAKLSKEGMVNLQLLALNELFEVAFFTSLLNNVTEDKPGYAPPQGMSKEFVVKTLEAIVAQEELHALNVNGALQHFGGKPVLQCTDYIFGTTTLKDAIALAGTFTSVVLGTLQDVIFVFADNGDIPLTRAVASVLGNEAEQEGWFRVMQGQIPDELPFLTTSVRDFAFTALQGFAAPGSCPSVPEIPLKTLEPLTVVDKPTTKTETIKYSFSSKNYANGKPLWVTYINQQNVPVVEPAQIVSNENGVVTVSATFPYDDQMLNGLTIASVTDCEGPFASADDVIPAAMAGPGLIIIQPASTADLAQHSMGYYVSAAHQN